MCRLCENENSPVFPVQVTLDGVKHSGLLCEKCLREFRRKNRRQIKARTMAVEVNFSRSQVHRSLNSLAGKL